MKSSRLGVTRFAITFGVISFALSLYVNAQVQTTTTTSKEAPTVTTTVTSGEVVYINGRDLIVKLDDGTLCLLYTSPSPRDPKTSRMPSSA